MEVHVSLDGRRGIAAQIYRQIRDAILEGRPRAQEALPSSRALARRLGVSRNTVLLAYDLLRSEGFVETRLGAGTFVSDGIRPRSRGALADSPLRSRPLWDDFPEGVGMSATRADFDFRPGLPDAGRFPFAAWRARMARQFYHSAVGTGAHIAAAGHPPLRAAIARHVGLSRGVRVTPDNVLVTNGSQQAVDLVARVLLEPGDTVAVEDPGYSVTRLAFVAHGCRVVAVDVDDEGLVVSALPEDVRLVYVTPSHQYPLGMAMSMARRQALLSWADRVDATIVEDDYDSEFRYGGRPLEPLQSLDRAGRVLYVGSFSKTMLPTLRLGFLVAPDSLQSALGKAKYAADWHTAVPVQAAMAEFIDDGLFAQHIDRMRRIYAERHELIMRLLERDFEGRLAPLPAAGGLHLAARLPEGHRLSDEQIAERASAAGVAVLPLSARHLSEARRQGLILGYGAIEAERIGAGLSRLSDCL